jgi:hypothetical protein
MDLKKQLGLACQTRNSSHKTEIIPYKKNKNKLRSSIRNQSNVEG